MGEGITGAPGDEQDADNSKWDTELQALLKGDMLEARFRELSAEERQKHARETRKQQKKARKEQRKARRRRWFRWTAWGLAAVVLVGGGTFAYLRFGHSLAGQGGPDDTQTVRHGAVPGISDTATAVSPLTDSGPPADPFSGSPADKWADGAAGITIPAARPHGQYTASQVKEAYQTTKKMLVAAALDKQTLLGGAPTSFATLLTQQQRNQFLSQLNKIGLDKHDNALSSREWLVQFAPGTTKLVGSGIKVRGTMTAKATKDSQGYSILQVNVDYIIVYAVEPPHAPDDWMRVVAQFDGPVDFGDWAQADTPFEPSWALGGPSIAGLRCNAKDGFVHPDYPSGPPDNSRQHGRTVNPYEFGEPGQIQGCQPTTGT